MRSAFAPASSYRRILARALAAFCICGPCALAQDWTAPAREFADQLRQRIPPPARLTWTVQNRSSLPEDTLGPLRHAIASELRNAGYQAAQPSDSVAQVRISVSENFQSLLWVAEVLRDETRSVVMVTIPRPPIATLRNTSNVVIRRKLLLGREEPILDLVAVSAPELSAAGLLVLGPSSVALYEMSGVAGQLVQTATVAPVKFGLRDMRGRIATRDDGNFEAILPGERCLGSFTRLANLDCHASDEPWPVADTPGGDATAHIVAGRNYFMGPLLVPDHPPFPVPDFYSAATLDDTRDSSWLLSTTDGRVRLLGPRGNPVEFQGWGSQFTAIKSACGGGTLVFATRPGDFAAPDAVQAFQIRGRAAEPMSAPVEFGGPVTVLRPSRDEGAAFAVARALPTGPYEAYRLSIACGD